jgi:hypothetical protein
VRWLANGVRGNADLVAYFYLRAASLLRLVGGFGLIATNTIAQGDTREVGLDELTKRGLELHRAIASEPWPGGANLEMATVWAQRGWLGTRTLDRQQVVGITPGLSTRSRVLGKPARLAVNNSGSFTGSKVYGAGFVLTPEEAADMLAASDRNAEVVRPYLGGRDLNRSPDGTPSRWVIDFREWPLERAREYVAPMDRVERLVRPERARVNRAAVREHWWRFEHWRADLYRSIASLDRCVVMAQVSRVVQPMFSPTERVFDQKLIVFAYNDNGRFGLLSSGIHREWAIAQGSTMRTDSTYTTTDCFETFVQPQLTPAVAQLGAKLNAHRSALMLDRQEGLTQTYNRFHDLEELAGDIVRLRELHVELDYAVRDAYGWTDFDLGHGFHETKFGTRFTFVPLARQEVLDRLLELNHGRYADEVRRDYMASRRPRSALRRRRAL